MLHLADETDSTSDEKVADIENDIDIKELAMAVMSMKSETVKSEKLLCDTPMSLSNMTCPSFSSLAHSNQTMSHQYGSHTLNSHTINHPYGSSHSKNNSNNYNGLGANNGNLGSNSENVFSRTYPDPRNGLELLSTVAEQLGDVHPPTTTSANAATSLKTVSSPGSAESASCTNNNNSSSNTASSSNSSSSGGGNSNGSSSSSSSMINSTCNSNNSVGHNNYSHTYCHSNHSNHNVNVSQGDCSILGKANESAASKAYNALAKTFDASALLKSSEMTTRSGCDITNRGNDTIPKIVRSKDFNSRHKYFSKELVNPHMNIGGLNIPQGLESMDAIELEMRMRLAELQRRYKEKQKELNRLQLKKDREEDVQSKRGPGRPRKRKLPREGPSLSIKHGGGTSPKPAGKDSSSKRKKLAEKLVDKVFRQSSQMPSSKRNRNNKALIAPGKMSTVLVKKNMAPSTTRSGADIIQPATGNIGGRGIQPLKPARKLGQMPSTESPISRVDAWSFNDDSQSLTSLRKKAPKLPAKNQKGFICADKVRPMGTGLMAAYSSLTTEDNNNNNNNNSDLNRAKKKKRKSEEGISIKTSPNSVLGSYDTKDSDGESCDTSGQGNKKRKPGRPKRCHQNKTFGVTETIVARKTKHLSFAQLKEADQQQQKQKNALNSSLHKTNTTPNEDKFKFKNDVRLKPFYIEEDWCSRRRSERIFLNDSSPQPSPNNIRGSAQNCTSMQNSLSTSSSSSSANNVNLGKSSTRNNRSSGAAGKNNASTPGTSVTVAASIGTGTSRTASNAGSLSSVPNVTSAQGSGQPKVKSVRKLSEKVKEKYNKAARKNVPAAMECNVTTAGANSMSVNSSTITTMSVTTSNTKNNSSNNNNHSSSTATSSSSSSTKTVAISSSASNSTATSISYHTCRSASAFSAFENSKLRLPSFRQESSENEGEASDFSSSDGDNIPLSALRERTATPEPRCCTIEKEDLKDGLRVLLFRDGLFYEGEVKAIRPPDVYGVVIDNERGNRPHIYSQEEILKDAVLDVTPGSPKYLPEGTRMCAYWSQQYSCLYPGTISKSSPNPHADKSSVSVEFDDGDTGRIPIDHIRMLPQDFPIASYDQNPILLMGKRRRKTITEDVDSRKSSASDTITGGSSSDSKRASKSKSSSSNAKSTSSSSKSQIRKQQKQQKKQQHKQQKQQSQLHSPPPPTSTTPTSTASGSTAPTPPAPTPPAAVPQVFKFDSLVKTQHKSNADVKARGFKVLSTATSSSSSSSSSLSSSSASSSSSSSSLSLMPSTSMGSSSSSGLATQAVVSNNTTTCHKSAAATATSSGAGNSSTSTSAAAASTATTLFKDALHSKYATNANSTEVALQRKHKGRKELMPAHSVHHRLHSHKSSQQKDKMKKEKKSTASVSKANRSGRDMSLSSNCGESFLFNHKCEKKTVLPNSSKIVPKTPNSSFSIIRAASFDYKTNESAKSLSHSPPVPSSLSNAATNSSKSPSSLSSPSSSSSPTATPTSTATLSTATSNTITSSSSSSSSSTPTPTPPPSFSSSFPASSLTSSNSTCANTPSVSASDRSMASNDSPFCPSLQPDLSRHPSSSDTDRFCSVLKRKVTEKNLAKVQKPVSKNLKHNSSKKKASERTMSSENKSKIAGTFLIYH
eukprot:XP_014768607.1 PREDICTED: serine-rich adhesin for platelets-like [Octopus bimaculoides]